jgi:cell division protein FtsN
MALLGVRSDIKRGQVNKRTVYRVYTDPMEDPEEVNHVSEQLQQANIEILLKRVSD